MWILAHGIRVLWQQWTNSHGLLSAVEEKGQHGHCLKRRAAPPLPGQTFIVFLGTLHGGWSSFIHYAQVHFRWLPFTDNKAEDVASYIRGERYLQMQREKWLNWLHSILLV